MSHRLVIMPRAERDVEKILIFLKRHSRDGAQRWFSAFETVLQRLREAPTSYGFAPEDGMGGYQLHQVLFKTRRGRTYRAVFTIRDNTIFILRVRGPGQAPLTADELPPTP